jgi:hypothetical protein
MLPFAGVIRPKLSFQLDTNPYALTGILLIVYAMLVYPILGRLLGHGYPRSPSFGSRLVQRPFSASACSC